MNTNKPDKKENKYKIIILILLSIIIFIILGTVIFWLRGYRPVEDKNVIVSYDIIYIFVQLASVVALVTTVVYQGGNNDRIAKRQEDILKEQNKIALLDRYNEIYNKVKTLLDRIEKHQFELNENYDKLHKYNKHDTDYEIVNEKYKKETREAVKRLFNQKISNKLNILLCAADELRIIHIHKQFIEHHIERKLGDKGGERENKPLVGYIDFDDHNDDGFKQLTAEFGQILEAEYNNLDFNGYRKIDEFNYSIVLKNYREKYNEFIQEKESILSDIDKYLIIED